MSLDIDLGIEIAVTSFDAFVDPDTGKGIGVIELYKLGKDRVCIGEPFKIRLTKESYELFFDWVGLERYE